MAEERRLAPGKIAETLFAIVPDRDEKASHLSMECFLTLRSNEFSAPPTIDELKSPKVRRFALRSLAIRENFFDGHAEKRTPTGSMSLEALGKGLSKAEDFAGSENLPLLREALAGLIDPSTTSGQRGTWLLFPFNEALLWYDARKPAAKPWDVRKVNMRGSGITLARILSQSPFSDASRSKGINAVAQIQDAMTKPSQLKGLAEGIEQISTSRAEPELPKIEADEKEAWALPEERKDDLESFGEQLCQHAENAMSQDHIGHAARLWSLRNLFALDLAIHTLRKAWQALDIPDSDRYIVMSVGGPPRAANPVRQQSEETYQRARIQIREATIRTIAKEMVQIVGEDSNPDWASMFESRSNLDELYEQLAEMGPGDDFRDIARQIHEGAAYDRAGEGLRVLLESIEFLQSTGQYRYFGATPEVLAAMVGALSDQMPMSSREFFKAIYREWGIVVAPETAQNTSLMNRLDGADLARNARRLESMLADSGLAVAMSDSTTVVGERNRRAD